MGKEARVEVVRELVKGDEALLVKSIHGSRAWKSFDWDTTPRQGWGGNGEVKRMVIDLYLHPHYSWRGRGVQGAQGKTHTTAQQNEEEDQ